MFTDTSAQSMAQDRAGLERLLHCCARPPFACERLRKAGSRWVYRCAQQHSEPGSHPHNKRGAKAEEIALTPLEQIDRIAKLVPQARTHRHRYCGVLAPNSLLRAAVVALAQSAAVQAAQAQAEPASTDAGEGALEAGKLRPTQAESRRWALFGHTKTAWVRTSKARLSADPAYGDQPPRRIQPRLSGLQRPPAVCAWPVSRPSSAR
jgi:hypothetical protein